MHQSLLRAPLLAPVQQMFELLLTLLGNRRYSALLRPASKEMVYLTIGYMQVRGVRAMGREGHTRVCVSLKTTCSWQR